MSETKRIRVVIADDCDTVRRQLEIILRSDCEVVGLARDGRETLSMVEKTRPDVVLVDIHMPGMNGIDATRSIVDRFPEVAVVVVTVETEVDYLRQAMAAGARDYLFKPSEPEEIRAVVERVVREHRERQERQRQGNDTPGAGIWSFCGARGGDGRTTLVLGLAGELRARGFKVAVVDLDLHFGDVAFLLGVQAGRRNLHAYGRADDAEARLRAVECGVVDESGIHLAVPPAGSFEAARIEPDRVLELVRELEAEFDYVLVDMPIGVPEDHLEILDRSRFVVTVGGADVLGLKNHRRLLSILQEIGYQAPVLRPVLCRVGDQEDLDGLLRAVRLDPEVRLSEDVAAVDEALRARRPVTRVAPASAYNRQVRRLLAKLTGLSERPEAASEAPAPGFLGRLVGWAA